MKTIKLTPEISNKPCDIERRLAAARSHAETLVAYLGGVDPAALPEGAHAAASSDALRLLAAIDAAQLAAPKKRSYVRKEEAAAAAAPAEPAAPEAAAAE